MCTHHSCFTQSRDVKCSQEGMEYNVSNPFQKDMLIYEQSLEHDLDLNITSPVASRKQHNNPRGSTNMDHKIDSSTSSRGSHSHWKPINPKLAIYGDEYATPYARNAIDYKADGEFILQACAMFAVLLQISNRVVFTRIAHALIPKTKGLNAKTLHKFCTAGWKFASYAGLVAMGIWALWDQQRWFWNTETYASIFHNNRIPWRIRAYYLTEISYYLFSCVSIFFEPQMKDRRQMLFHHAVTLSLMLSSYYDNTIRFGVAMMILHDVADPLMELAKLFNYVKYKRCADVTFLLFMATFIYLRVYIFPRHIIYAAWRFRILMNLPSIKNTFFCFLCLWCLHIFWAVLILKVFKNAIWEGDDKGDVREVDSDGEVEAVDTEKRSSSRLKRRRL